MKNLLQKITMCIASIAKAIEKHNPYQSKGGNSKVKEIVGPPKLVSQIHIII